MELVRTVTNLRFSEAFAPWMEMRSIIRDVGENPSAQIEGSPIVIDLKNKRQRVVLHIKALDFIQEGMRSAEDSIEAALEKLTKLNSASKLPQVAQITSELDFIEPYAVPFHELLLLMKDRFLRPGALADCSTDVGLIFDQVEGDVLKHYQTGPMEKSQLLNMYLHYPREKLPDVFAFLSLQYQLKKAFPFDVDYVRRFLHDAGQWQAHEACSVFGYIKKGGN